MKYEMPGGITLGGNIRKYLSIQLHIDDDQEVSVFMSNGTEDNFKKLEMPGAPDSILVSSNTSTLPETEILHSASE